MSVFRDFFVKEKPVFTGITRGIGGFGFGSGGGASASSLGSASGGNIDAQPGGDGYNYHVFTTSGSLVVTGGDIPDCELLCVGPGGGGSQGNGSSGGGGAGGVVHVTGHTLLSGTYTITIPSGGIGGNIPEGSPSPLPGVQGADLTMTSPAPFSITAKGGGGGQSWGTNNPNPQANANGGSGGGSSGNPNNVFGVAQQPTTPYVVATGTVNRYGNPGGPTGGNPAPGTYRGSGGGGAGAVGQNWSPSHPHYGGSGGGGQPFPSFIGPNPAFAPLPSAWKTAVGPTGHYAGGGGGGSENGGTATPAPGGQGGGGASGAGPNTVPAETMRGVPAVANTGGGGGAGWWDPGLAARGGNGANGIVLLRYQA